MVDVTNGVYSWNIIKSSVKLKSFIIFDDLGERKNKLKNDWKTKIAENQSI